MLKAELMKCPFCGGPATSTVKDFHPIGLRYGASCTRCDCWCDFRSETEEAAAARWNTRSIQERRSDHSHAVCSADDVRALMDAMGLFPSVIRSGEQWTPTCEAVKENAMAALGRIRSSLTN